MKQSIIILSLIQTPLLSEILPSSLPNIKSSSHPSTIKVSSLLKEDNYNLHLPHISHPESYMGQFVTNTEKEDPQKVKLTQKQMEAAERLSKALQAIELHGPV